MLNKEQKLFLKSKANQLKALYQLGKNDIGETHIALLDKALTARELIKVSLLKSVEETTKEMAMIIATQTNSDIIETKGRTFVLYRRNTKDPKIALPK
ncbi:MAG: YhbY family RNA-binding protein [Bacilli bacterium]|nr:YhbY family RNA-binding protein [Bacilli bacterium]